ncbi:MAG: protein dehydratase, partial [Alphaproteobacteria bacterium]
GGALAVRERQDVVYREAPTGGAAAAAADPAPTSTTSRQVTADATMLFRYSAITFNGHRIHYDAPYAREVEGYGGLVVHGPLQATLMAHMAAEIHGQAPTRFSFRGRSPIFDDSPFMLHATEDDDGISLWTAREGGPVAMQAKAGWT